MTLILEDKKSGTGRSPHLGHGKTGDEIRGDVEGLRVGGVVRVFLAALIGC